MFEFDVMTILMWCLIATIPGVGCYLLSIWWKSGKNERNEVASCLTLHPRYVGVTRVEVEALRAAGLLRRTVQTNDSPIAPT